NELAKVGLKPTPVINDLTYLRRVSVDLIGRIPTGVEIREYMKWPAEQRRAMLVDKLISDERFADRWTAFMGDMLRLRSNATGGAALTAYVHQAIQENMPYDELCRRLLAANGKANSTPEVGFILGDDANPTAMAAVTAQVFMGVRIACAECHDHPFDVWTREDFYSLAAFFGKTRRIESQITRVVYTTETTESTVMWPPEDDAEDRHPMKPRFPFDIAGEKDDLEFISRLIDLRNQQEIARKAAEKKSAEVVVDDLLVSAADRVAQQTSGKNDDLGVESEAKLSIRQIDIQGDLYRRSELRAQLAEMVTSPRNRFFSRSLVNRLWKELVGQGFVEPIDDFRADNPPSHPETLDFLAEEFVATGFDFRNLVQMIVTSDAYARSHVAPDADEVTRVELESNFLATPMRRMLGESLYDSIVSAGHLFEYKHVPGTNERTVREPVRVRVYEDGEKPKVGTLLARANAAGGPAMMKGRAMKGQAMQGSAYALENAIELDFAALLKKPKVGVEVDRMNIMSAEELEAQRMAMMADTQGGGGAKYVTKMVERVFDDNPKFSSTFRMASPAPMGHFVRVFGQTSRADLGEMRGDAPNMRQALMMLNGRLTNEASRVGPLEG
ncbi:MAG: hypothetical protein ACI9G1_003222, partial [Pirellulaceae bacterium]